MQYFVRTSSIEYSIQFKLDEQEIWICMLQQFTSSSLPNYKQRTQKGAPCCFNLLQECIPVLNFNVPGGAVVYSCACAQMLRADFSTPQQSEDLSLDMTMLYTEVRWSNMALPSAPSTETKNKLCGWYWKVQLWAFLPWVASDSTFAGSFALSDLARPLTMPLCTLK